MFYTYLWLKLDTIYTNTVCTTSHIKLNTGASRWDEVHRTSAAIFYARSRTPSTARAVLSVINRAANWNVHVSWWATPTAFYVELHNTVFMQFSARPGRRRRCVGMQNDERYELPLAARCPSFMQPPASFPHRCQLACTYQTTYHISIRLKLIQWLLPEANIQTIPKAFNPTYGTCIARHTEVYCSQGRRVKDSCFHPLEFMTSD